MFGKEDWSSYCLAHLFTYQSYENSVLGLAYVSSPLHYELGGICSRQTFRSANRQPVSLNIGLSSYKSVSRNQGRLLQREAELVTAHEFGHNWGSEHDPVGSDCSPSSGGQGGNYIMYAYSNTGHDRNNYHFSTCSINAISQVLKTKSEQCFVSEKLSYCGNDRIEYGEECDAGPDTRLGNDPCCDKNCKLKPNAQCSDSNHNCCLKCKIAPRDYKCYSSPNYLECFEDHSFCDGQHYECPTQKPKPVNSICHSFDFGKCDSTGHCLSICHQRGTAYTSCLCSDNEEKCQICCRETIGNRSGQCRPFNEMFNLNNLINPYYLTNGRACIDGLCENFKCKQKVKDYVTRFWRVIQTVTVSSFAEFMKRNIVGTIIIISLLVWIPSSCCIHFCIVWNFCLIWLLLK